jgi:hypothetical protein
MGTNRIAQTTPINLHQLLNFGVRFGYGDVFRSLTKLAHADQNCGCIPSLPRWAVVAVSIMLTAGAIAHSVSAFERLGPAISAVRLEFPSGERR